MLKALKPGGLIILEAFNPDQLQYQIEYNSGGPPIREMLYESEMLRQDFAGSTILELTETVTELHEGQYHEGKAYVSSWLVAYPILLLVIPVVRRVVDWLTTVP
jgi:Protein of unknown function (DUF2798)